MEHPKWPVTLDCGCICAGHMEQNIKGAKRREKTLRSAADRKRRWLTRSWRISTRGNQYLNVDGFNVVIYPAGSGWAFRITDRATDETERSNRLYPSQEAAKLQAFDVLHPTKPSG